MSLTSPILEAKSLGAIRGDNVLFADISFTLHKQQALLIKGANGCGKSTLLRILCGLMPAQYGEINWQGAAIAEASDYKNALYYLGHKLGLKDSLTVKENIVFNLSLRNVSVSSQELFALAEHLNISALLDKPCYQLSAGQKQRTSLMCLILSDTKIWILDEPYTALDKQGQEVLSKAITKHQTLGGCVILTAHHELMLGNMQTLKLGNNA